MTLHFVTWLNYYLFYLFLRIRRVRHDEEIRKRNTEEIRRIFDDLIKVLLTLIYSAKATDRLWSTQPHQVPSKLQYLKCIFLQYSSTVKVHIIYVNRGGIGKLSY